MYMNEYAQVIVHAENNFPLIKHILNVFIRIAMKTELLIVRTSLASMFWENPTPALLRWKVYRSTQSFANVGIILSQYD
jgi:hypothetical protein